MERQGGKNDGNSGIRLLKDKVQFRDDDLMTSMGAVELVKRDRI